MLRSFVFGELLKYTDHSQISLSLQKTKKFVLLAFMKAV